MKSKILLLSMLFCALCGFTFTAQAQSNNPISIYEGDQIIAVEFDYLNMPADTSGMAKVREQVQASFPVYPYTYFNRMQTEYYAAQTRNLSFVKSLDVLVSPMQEGGLKVTLEVTLMPPTSEPKKFTNIFRDIRSFPVIYSKGTTYLTSRVTASEIMYSNNNAWYAHPDLMLAGNPLTDGPSGKGYTGWVEGYAMGGLYGITQIVPKLNLHLYGGASYLISFSAGRELFSSRSRFHGGVEDAYFGLVGGAKTGEKSDYGYNIQYGRKPFILGNGWLIVNTSMNGQDRAALQLNARTAARRLFLATYRLGRPWGSVMGRVFQVRPDELPILDSHTAINGIDVDVNANNRLQIAGSVLYVPKSKFNYYLPDGTSHQRKGLWVYNIRAFGNPAPNRSGVFFKTELGYQRNKNFDMRAFAGYAHVGYNFAKAYGRPSLSYRFAYFPGDDPDKKRYGRWDALYTGGNGEQWVQGSNMYKVIQNSNEITHMLQFVHSPAKKLQTVTQAWLFLADQKNNIGGNPALSTLKSKFYGTELNFTLKYFHSKQWYFHTNAAITFPGTAIRKNIPGAKTWFSFMFFVRYSL